MEEGSWIEYHPLTTVADGSPIEFDVGPKMSSPLGLPNFERLMSLLRQFKLATAADTTQLSPTR